MRSGVISRKNLGKPKMYVETASKTDMGMVRSNNEDSLFTIDESGSINSRFNSIGLYIIADGMGGHQGGEIASKIATQVVSATILDNLTNISKSQNPLSIVKEAIEKASKEICDVAGTRQELHSMGTTITMGLRLENELYIGHVGDSRAYLVRGQEIERLTADHSLIAHLLKEGTITPEEARTHPNRGVILRCLGLSGKVSVDSYYQDGKEAKLLLKNNDRIIFCSDGLTDCVTDDEIYNYVTKFQTTGEVCEKLIELSNIRGGEDNISVIVVRVNQELNDEYTSK
jgi:serine/threonine protein phosphatase PrpC